MGFSSKSEKVFWPSLEMVKSHHSISQGFLGRGDVEFQGPFEFGGKWSGMFFSKDVHSHLIFLPTSEFSGTRVSERITVEGLLTDVEIKAAVFHAKAGARVYGRIQADTLIIEEGAVIQGRFIGKHEKKKRPADSQV